MIDRSLFKAEDFLIDNTFQAYCAGTDPLCVSYWEKWIEMHPQQAETVREARRLYIILSGNKKPLNSQQDLLRAQLKPAQDLEEEAPVYSLRKNYGWLKIAVAAVIVFGFIFLYQNSYKEQGPAKDLQTSFSTKAGERKKITLSDGSVVLLNAKSSLKLSPAFNTGNREVTLIGEAYFDVSHDKDKPFKVITEDFDINVLGTTFNVKVYPGEATSEATLIKGLIQMEGKGGKSSSITLKPSQKVIFHKNIESQAEDTPKITTGNQPEISINHYTKVKDSTIVEMAWTENRLEILDQDFAEIKGVLERWYDVEISFSNPEVSKYRFTATFNDENIEEVLNALQKAEHFNYEIKGRTIIISK